MSPVRLTLLVTALALCAIFAWYASVKFHTEPISPLQTASVYEKDLDQCRNRPRVIRFPMSDVYMRGLIDPGTTVRATLGWYLCHPIQVGDLVLYRFSSEKPPVVKRVVAVGGQSISVEIDPAGQGWILTVDKQVIDPAKPYIFGSATAPPPLKLYADQNHDVIQQGHVVLFSAFPPGDSDSGIFGVVSVEDVIGHVEIDSH